MTYWRTRDGRMLKISDMETSHLINAIKKIERSREGWRRNHLQALRQELERRKSAASEMIQSSPKAAFRQIIIE